MSDELKMKVWAIRDPDGEPILISTSGEIDAWNLAMRHVVKDRLGPLEYNKYCHHVLKLAGFQCDCVDINIAVFRPMDTVRQSVDGEIEISTHALRELLSRIDHNEIPVSDTDTIKLKIQ